MDCRRSGLRSAAVGSRPGAITFSGKKQAAVEITARRRRAPGTADAARLDEIEAVDAREAIQIAARDFKQHPSKLIAVRRP
jgi:hypothetical protein